MYGTAGMDNKSMRLLNTAIFNCYVLGFAPAPRFFLSKILCRLYKSPLGEIIN